MILRDYYCPACNYVWKDVFEDLDEEEPGCPRCDKQMERMCNGGTKSRWRFADWPSDPRFYRGQTSSSPPTAVTTDEDGNVVPLEKKGGGNMHDQERFEPEPRAERRDVIRHDIDRKRGTLPMVFDQKSE